MPMMDWNTYRQQLVAGVSGLAELSPETVKGYGAMEAAGRRNGHLDANTRELIAVPVSITLRCDGCITVHTGASDHVTNANEGSRTTEPAISSPGWRMRCGWRDWGTA